MKKKFNLVGNTFTHLSGGNKGYSVHGKESKYVEWVQDGSGYDTFFVDDAMKMADQYERKSGAFKFGWLLESKWISPMANEVRANPYRWLGKLDFIFTHDKELLAVSDKFKFVPAQGSWIDTNFVPPHPKPKLVSMIASKKNFTDGHRVRLEWAEKLRGQLDLYGRGFNQIERKEEGLFDYMFSVAIENGQYETYFTEKILDCFLSFTVPIYLGAPDIGDHFNMDGIIVLTDDFDVSQLSEERYWSMTDAICDNYRRAKEMEVLEDYIWEHYFRSIIQ